MKTPFIFVSGGWEPGRTAASRKKTQNLRIPPRIGAADTPCGHTWWLIHSCRGEAQAPSRDRLCCWDRHAPSKWATRGPRPSQSPGLHSRRRRMGWLGLRGGARVPPAPWCSLRLLRPERAPHLVPGARDPLELDRSIRRVGVGLRVCSLRCAGLGSRPSDGARAHARRPTRSRWVSDGRVPEAGLLHHPSPTSRPRGVACPVRTLRLGNRYRHRPIHRLDDPFRRADHRALLGGRHGRQAYIFLDPLRNLGRV